MSFLRAKPIGVMQMIDQGEQDDKIIAVHADDPEFKGYNDINELPKHRLMEIRRCAFSPHDYRPSSAWPSTQQRLECMAQGLPESGIEHGVNCSHVQLTKLSSPSLGDVPTCRPANLTCIAQSIRIIRPCTPRMVVTASN